MTVTNVLIAINVIAYIWEVSTGALNSDAALLAHGALYGPAVVQGHQYWRIVSGAFSITSTSAPGRNPISPR